MADLTQSITRRFLRFRNLSLLVLDILAWSITLVLATAVRLELVDTSLDIRRVGSMVLIAAAAHVFAAVLAPTYALNRIGTGGDAEATVTTWAIASVPIIVADVMLSPRPVPLSALALAIPAALVIMFGMRFGWRRLSDRTALRATNLRRVLVFGAGDGGEQIIRAMKQDPDSVFQPVG
ncbi:MAG: hypothetical protein HKN24_08990, partial [Acidimicrobiales bacterium]|nr:hypothetical protein [Acidimicrobiales bacterium]